MKRQRTSHPVDAFDIATLQSQPILSVGSGHASHVPANDEQMVVQVRTAEYVTIDLFAAISGLTASAVRNMIHEGKWTEGRQYQRRAGRVYISLKGYEKWVATGLV